MNVQGFIDAREFDLLHSEIGKLMNEKEIPTLDLLDSASYMPRPL